MYEGLDGVIVPAWVTNVAFLRDTVMAQAALHGWDLVVEAATASKG